jgi:hypothetical protein
MPLELGQKLLRILDLLVVRSRHLPVTESVALPHIRGVRESRFASHMKADKTLFPVTWRACTRLSWQELWAWL